MDLTELEVKDVAKGRFQRKNSKLTLLLLAVLLIIVVGSGFLLRYWAGFLITAYIGFLGWFVLAIVFGLKQRKYVKKTVEEWRKNG